MRLNPSLSLFIALATAVALGCLPAPDPGMDDSGNGGEGSGEDGGDSHGGDDDRDGYMEYEDCNDMDSEINPGAEEIWYDGVDQDCDGESDYDADRDGHDSDEHGGDDCMDDDASVHPGATEVWYDGGDQDCDGASDFDADGDGFDSEEHGGGEDCEDLNKDVNPDAEEICGNDVDDNCSGWDDCRLEGEYESDDASVQLKGSTSGEYLGESLSFAGDLDGDGYDDVVVGAPDYGYGGTDLDNGGVYLFRGPLVTDQSASSAHLRLRGEAGSRLGEAVEGQVDLQGDGYVDLIVSAPASDTGFATLGCKDHGSVYIFQGPVTRSGAVSISTADISLDGPCKGTTGFGSGVTLDAHGDADGDGIEDVLIGSTSGPYAFFRPATMTVKTTGELADNAWVLTVDDWSSGPTNAWFIRDTGTGSARIALTSPYWTEGEGNNGAVLILEEAPDSHDEFEVGGGIVGGKGAELGTSLSPLGDLDGDGLDEIAVGAPGLVSGGIEGVVYVLDPDKDEGEAASLAKATFVPSKDATFFGWDVAGVGDLDEDGHADVMLSTPFYQEDSEGLVWLHYGPLTGTVTMDEAPEPGDGAAIFRGEEGDNLGYSLAGGFDVTGDASPDLLLGAPGWQSSGSSSTVNTGRVLVFETWTQ